MAVDREIARQARIAQTTAAQRTATADQRSREGGRNDPTTGTWYSFSRYGVSAYPIKYSKRPDVAIFQDKFNRADGAIGAADTDQIWEALAGTAAIESNVVKGLIFPSVQVIDSGLSNGRLTMKVAVASNDMGAVFRASDADNFWYFQVVTAGINLHRRQAGVFNLVEGLSDTVASGDIIETLFVDDRIVCLVNSVIKMEHLDQDFNLTADKHGFRLDTSIGRLDDIKFSPY